MNLSKGEIGEDASSLLGSIIVTSIQLATLFRASQDEYARKPFFLYIDECQSFISLSFSDILSEARKYKLSLFLTHQYLEQLPENTRAAIFGNVGTLISFRVGAQDAAFLAKEFYPVFNEMDFVNLPLFSIYIKLMIGGATSKPFSAVTLPVKSYTNSLKSEIINLSRNNYSRFRKEIEKDIFSRQQIQFEREEPATLF